MIASRQYGVFTRAQVLSLGFTARMIHRRLESGAWVALHPGVYAVAGSAPSWERDQIAACYWSRGPAAGLSAGYLHGLPRCDSPTLEVVTKDRRRAMPRCGITVHCTKRLPVEQVVVVRGLPTTTVERTLLDLCGRFNRRDAAIALDNALTRGLTTLGLLDYCLHRTARRGRNGCARLRDLVKARVELDRLPTTPLETVVLEMLLSSGRRPPKLQYAIHRRDGSFVAQPDFVYPEEKLVIEAHSRLWHEGLEFRTKDAARDRSLRREGFDVLYVTWADATRYRERTLAIIDEYLEGGRGPLAEADRRHLLLDLQDGSA